MDTTADTHEAVMQAEDPAGLPVAEIRELPSNLTRDEKASFQRVAQRVLARRRSGTYRIVWPEERSDRHSPTAPGKVCGLKSLQS